MRASQELDVRALYMGTVTSMGSGGDASSGQSGSDRRTDDERIQGRAPGRQRHHRVRPRQRGRQHAGRPWPPDHVRHLLQRVPGQLLAAVEPTTGPSGSRPGSAARGRSSSTARPRRATCCAPTRSPSTATTTTTVTLDLTLNPFIDGGWYWFDLEAGDGELVLESAEWMIETDRLESGRVTIGITTFNRPDFCADQLVTLSQDPSTLEILDEVIVVDQGNQKVVDTEKYDQRQGGARRPAAHHRPAQPRRLRRLLARDVRGRCSRVPPTTSCCSTTTSSASSRASCARSPSPTWPSGPRWSVVTCSASTTAR